MLGLKAVVLASSGKSGKLAVTADHSNGFIAL